MNRRTATPIIAAAMLTALLIGGNLPTPTIDEDSPAWNCATMGNQACGGTNEFGDRVITFHGMRGDAPGHEQVVDLPDAAATSDGVQFLMDTWTWLDAETSDALSEGEQPLPTDCLINRGTTTWVACADGSILSY